MKELKKAVPCGTQVLVERIGDKELMKNTALEMPESYIAAQQGAPQGFIRGVGVKTVPNDWGFDLGDRVVLSGSFTPLPEIQNDAGRQMILVEPHQIKAVLV